MFNLKKSDYGKSLSPMKFADKITKIKKKLIVYIFFGVFSVVFIFVGIVFEVVVFDAVAFAVVIKRLILLNHRIGK